MWTIAVTYLMFQIIGCDTARRRSTRRWIYHSEVARCRPTGSITIVAFRLATIPRLQKTNAISLVAIFWGSDDAGAPKTLHRGQYSVDATRWTTRCVAWIACRLTYIAMDERLRATTKCAMYGNRGLVANLWRTQCSLQDASVARGLS